MPIPHKKTLYKKILILTTRDKLLFMPAINQAVKEVFGNSANDQEKQEIAGKLATEINNAGGIDKLTDLIERITEKEQIQRELQLQQQEEDLATEKARADEEYMRTNNLKSVHEKPTLPKFQ